jgi:hypothetical protein
MLAYQSQTLHFRLNPYDYFEELRPLHTATRAAMSRLVPCRIWTKGNLDSKGYGRCRISGKRVRVHRLAWIEAYGAIPPGLCVCHFCDVRLCTRPEHLFLGTKGDNSTDMQCQR